MTQLRIASLFVAVIAGAYADLRLIAGQISDFGVAAAICAGSSVAAGLIAYTGWRHRKAVTREGAAVWQGRDQQAPIAADQLCPLCGGTRQKLSDSTRFVGQPSTPLCVACLQPSTRKRHEEPGFGGAGPEDPGVELLT